MILFVTNVETDLLAVRSALHRLPHEFPAVSAVNAAVETSVPVLDDVDLVVVRLLGGRRAWEEPFDELARACARAGAAFVAVGGETAFDGELAARSTVPSAAVAEFHRYAAAGGAGNLLHGLRFLADTVLLTGHGFDPPAPVPDHGVWDPATTPRRGRPLVGVVFYRAHLVAGNTTFVERLAAALDDAGADVLTVYCYSLRPGTDGTVPVLDLCREASVDALITTVLAMGSAGADDQWDATALESLGVPVVQAPSCTRPRDEWLTDDAGLSPLDVATGVALPEFDGRIIGPAFAFKEVVDDGDSLGVAVSATRADHERATRLATLALRHAGLRHRPEVERRVAIVLSAYPTKRSRLGNAVGLDTPASAIRLLRDLRDAGHRVDRIPDDGDALMAELVDRLTYEHPELTAVQAAASAGRIDVDRYIAWFDQLPAGAREQVVHCWGPPPGDVYVHEGQLCFAGLDLGNVLVAVQPPRGFGPDPIGTYHAPDVPPPHHYLAFYRWLDDIWGADAVVHLGKHGTLEWLPGKANALSQACFPDAALGAVPLVYPFVVNDPGEGTQAKRRAHAVIVDHLPPPMTRAETYDDLARLERLLDTYAQAQAMDPAKLPALRQQVWELLVDAEIHRDLELGTEPDEGSFDDVILHVDGYLCALKDAQIRGGLHVLGEEPEGEPLVDLVLAVTRLPQGGVPSLRATVAGDLGIDLAAGRRHEVDAVEAEARQRVDALAVAGWAPAAAGDDPTLRWVASTLVPALRRTGDERANVLAALAGRHVPAGPSGAPTRGAAHALPTGRNFYSIDPKSLPSPLSWEVGCKLADEVVDRFTRETGEPPSTVGIVLWGTAAMRTGGDDAAQALALLGVRPVWEPESARVAGVELIPDHELGRPRVDVTLRISGFFRDAFPHLVALLDDAVRLVHGQDTDPRIFGPPPGGYGSGVLPVLEQGSWRADVDLGEVYLAWSGFSYGRDAMGAPAPEALRRRMAAIDVALKNQDNREHDIFDSDDYLQDHGGMVAAVRSLTGQQPRAWFGDSADPSSPRVRALSEEAARVVRSRVLNPKWIDAMRRHGYKGAFELAATVDYLFGYDATTGVVEDWMYERVTDAYVGDAEMRAFFRASNPSALRAIAERLLEAQQRGMWPDAPEASTKTLTEAVLEAEGWEEGA